MTSDLLGADGKPAFGLYTGQIRQLDLDSCAPPSVSSLFRRFRAKRWRFAGLFSPHCVAGVAVVQAGYVGSTFAYAFDLASDQILEFRAQSALGRHCRVSDDLERGEAVYKRGRDLVSIIYGLEGGLTQVEVDVQTRAGPLRIEATIEESAATCEPHQVITPTPGGNIAFTHKAAGLPATGRIEVPAATFELGSGEAFAATDHSAGYHDRHWEWRWSSLAGRAASGTRVGLNLVDPIYHETIHENAMWVESRRYPVGRARFDFDRAKILEPWRMTTDDGVVDLTFVPQGERSETIDAGVLMSNFHQPVGLYSGRLRPPGGDELVLEGVAGVAEDHVAKW